MYTKLSICNYKFIQILHVADSRQSLPTLLVSPLFPSPPPPTQTQTPNKQCHTITVQSVVCKLVSTSTAAHERAIGVGTSLCTPTIVSVAFIDV